MQTAANHQDMSAVDALWTLYQQQSRRVRDAFRSRIAQDEIDGLIIRTEDEAKALTLLRGRDIKAGRTKLIPHEEVMQEMEQMLASGEDVNVVVVDTEVYSNTGGQSSKATPAGAVAKFATSGKKIRKKDLGMIAKSYGYVYVAQVAMGASQAQYFCRKLRTPLKSKSNEVSNVIKEAEAYHGPSLIICYAPCINHGIKIGMGRTQNEEKKAVECGYWHLWHYNPAEEEAGKNGFHLDSKEPDWSKFRDFIMGEVRYNSLMKTFPQEAEELFVATERNAKLRYEGYKKLSEM